MGLHLDYCYPLSVSQKVPDGQVLDGVFGWNFTNAEHDWAYPLSVDGHVFRSNDMLQMLEAIHPDDADLMIHVKDKYLPYPGLDYDLFCEAYPGILPAREKLTATEAIPENKVFVEVVERTEPLTKEEEKLFKKIPQKSNKGKSRWNNGVENFMVMTEEALAKGFLPGYIKK